MSDAEIKIEWFGDKVEAKVIDAAMLGLKKGAEAILGEAKKQVPVDTGTLMRSGTVEENEGEKSFTISFNTPYAMRQHEHHSSKSKYLERPFLENKPKLQGLVDRELKKL